MRRSSRLRGRTDYLIFHRTGEKVEKAVEGNTDNMSEHEGTITGDQETSGNTQILDPISKVKLQLDAVSEDIDDFIDENPIEDIAGSITDLDLVITKMEETRSLYRSKHKELSALLSSQGVMQNSDDEDEFPKKVAMMKGHILHAKAARRKIRSTEGSDKDEQIKVKEEAFAFLMKDINRQLNNLEVVLIDDVEALGEKDLVRRNKDLPEIVKRVEDLSNTFPEMLRYKSSTQKDEDEIERFKKRYEAIVIAKSRYAMKLKQVVEEKELDKEDVFKEANLNIRLQKFKGYNSHVDIYTFQTEFEKLFSRSTPKRMLPDLLKNNFLDGAALSLVKSVDNIEEIWIRLKKAFGDPKIMLGRKIEELGKIHLGGQSKDPEKTIDGLQKMINMMTDLADLSKKHKIENDLYFGDGLGRIFKLLGQGRATRWISETCDKELSNQERWENIKVFLERESKVLQQKLILLGKDDAKEKPVDSKVDDRQRRYAHHADEKKEKKNQTICSICNKGDHVATNGPNFSKVIQYFTCKQFVDMTPDERFAVVKEKGLCWQCLLPGAPAIKDKHKDGKCQRDFVCKHPSHDKYKRKKHVLLCEEHKDTVENMKLLDEYKRRCIVREKSVELPSYSKNIKLSFIVDNIHDSKPAEKTSFPATASEREIAEKAIYQLQTIEVEGQRYSMFYDSGCQDFVSRYQAVRRLGKRANQESPGPIQLGGVGGIVTESPYGAHSVKLPLSDGGDAKFSGICIDQITGEFPNYPIKGTVEKDIHKAYKRTGGNTADLPELPSHVGGEVDFLIGIKYLRYHPEKIFEMPSGLSIYKSKFKNADGGRGVIGGPHQIFAAIEKQFYLHSSSKSTFLCNQERLFSIGYQVNPDVKLLGFKPTLDDLEIQLLKNSTDGAPYEAHVSRHMKRFEEVENTGSEITYRCVKCRSCKSCKEADHNEAISIKEEVEEDLIAKSVVVDIKTQTSTAKLPLMYDPILRLAPNKHKALKVYYQQLKRFIRYPSDKEDVLKSEKKLQDLGFVDYMRNLSDEQQQRLASSKIQNFIPWRSVWKEDSISTPCRIVFDASQPTSSGYSLNDIMAKGRNNMNKLQEIVIRWSMHMIGFHSDVQKMYNCVKLREEDWCMQRYIWQEELDPQKIPEEKVIKTIIYGVKASGNLAERCLRETAKLSREEYPAINKVVSKDIYVDDFLSGENTEQLAYQRADELELVLNKGGFSLKGVTFSGKDPPESLSEDGISIVVARIKWFTKEDLISLNLGEMVFEKKRRGVKLKDVDQDSQWINGYAWIKTNSSAFPVKSVNEISLAHEEVLQIKKEAPYSIPVDTVLFTQNQPGSRKVPAEVIDRYQFSSYLIDPNKRR